MAGNLMKKNTISIDSMTAHQNVSCKGNDETCWRHYNGVGIQIQNLMKKYDYLTILHITLPVFIDENTHRRTCFLVKKQKAKILTGSKTKFFRQWNE